MRTCTGVYYRSLLPEFSIISPYSTSLTLWAKLFFVFRVFLVRVRAGGRDMSSTKDRMELSEAILALIEKKRIQTADETLGADIEQLIVESQFQDLEHEILETPGAIEPGLIRRRRIEN